MDLFDHVQAKRYCSVKNETPSGVWVSDGEVKLVKDKKDTVIGMKQSFTFCLKTNNTQTFWTMEEFQREVCLH